MIAWAERYVKIEDNKFEDIYVAGCPSKLQTYLILSHLQKCFVVALLRKL